MKALEELKPPSFLKDGELLRIHENSGIWVGRATLDTLQITTLQQSLIENHGIWG